MITGEALDIARRSLPGEPEEKTFLPVGPDVEESNGAPLLSPKWGLNEKRVTRPLELERARKVQPNSF